MKINILIGLLALMAGSLMAADPGPKETLESAAKKLGEKANYSWKTTVVVPEDSRFKPGPTEGKTEKDGFTHFAISYGENTSYSVIKGEKRATTTQDGEWKTPEELDKEEGFARFQAGMLRNLKTPVQEAAQLLSFAKDLKKENDVFASELTEEGAIRMQLFGPPRDNGPTVTGAKGSVKFWLQDGALTKYEFKLKGNIKLGDNEFPNERATTVEIKEVGTTKVEVPEPAKKKVS
jgi:hypothetical protein